MKYYRVAFQRGCCAVTAGLLLGLLFAAGTASAQLTNEQVAQIPAGQQPIAFSHKIHAGDNAIPCQYCHIYARRSASSGVPPVEICAGCHKLVGTQLDEVQKVMKFWNDQQPIPWVKIHDVPDFVHYPHFKHINAKNETFPDGVACQTCHGPIETMDVVEKFDPNFGTMGWCLECHLTVPGMLERKRAISESEHSTLVMNAKGPDGHFRPNLTDCLTCHK